MVIKGRVVATLTGQDVEGMKTRLFNGYFHIPTQSVKKKKRRRSR